ncbi:MAG: hypothetical protein HC837_10905 [Chloroflexaceae bacterium]|nr:hypothetical protein [Chloroflexaceae bacterium]
MSSEHLGAVLIAEVGSVITRVALADVVDGETRLIFQAETASTIEPPQSNATIGILQATAHIAEMTGRQLLNNGTLLMPQNSERDGINQMVASTSAAGHLALVIAAIASDVSAQSAIHASHAVYTTILQVVTLDDAMLDPTGSSTTSWVERQVRTLLNRSPDAVLMAGGLEGGTVDALRRLADIIAFTAFHTESQSRIKSDTHQREQRMCPVIFAGNSSARSSVLQAFEGRVKTMVVDNVRPSLAQENLDQARRELNTLYNRQVLTNLPGMEPLAQLCNKHVTTVCQSVGVMTRFLAERYQRQVLTVDVGSTSSSAFLARPGSTPRLSWGSMALAMVSRRCSPKVGWQALPAGCPFPCRPPI